ncbi:hypothetical protein [Terracoccus luteus]|uniref:Uncharacterized protein n=1 Tax=Terracoccus luteus TaxID=53356 RepID=A0A839PVI1_9MICO|nr:hypothetical protein [Terracoccus luteus]MBB2987053.1 hypothetical protein [Terracoccus luteus]MCP2172704.1 hypothetical protein [Terracoccus luteus]
MADLPRHPGPPDPDRRWAVAPAPGPAPDVTTDVTTDVTMDASAAHRHPGGRR